MSTVDSLHFFLWIFIDQIRVARALSPIASIFIPFDVKYIYSSMYRTPYDWRTPITYFITILIEAIELNFVAVAYFCSLYVFYGVCIFVMALVTDLKEQFATFDEKIVICGRSKLVTIKTNLEMRRFFVEIVEFHCDIRKWVIWLNNSNRPLFDRNLIASLVLL